MTIGYILKVVLISRFLSIFPSFECVKIIAGKKQTNFFVPANLEAHIVLYIFFEKVCDSEFNEKKVI